MDEQYLMATVRYVELNPVKAKLCTRPEKWQWSSTRAHLLAQDDEVVSVKPMLERVSDWKSYLSSNLVEEELKVIKSHSSSGRPAGNEVFVQNLEEMTGRVLRKKKPGPKPVIK